MKSKQAYGIIYPSRFVVTPVAGRRNNMVSQASGGSCLIGISTEYEALSDVTYAASDKNWLNVYEQSDVTILELGGNVTEGDRIVSDSNGRGIRGVKNQWAGAVAEEGGVALDKIRVFVAIKFIKFAREFSSAFSSAFD
jgi:hypothetical protein